MAVSRYLIEVFIFVTWIAMNVGSTYVLCVCVCARDRKRERERARERERERERENGKLCKLLDFFYFQHRK